MKVRQMLPQRKTFSSEWCSWRKILSSTLVKNAGKLALSLIIGLALLVSLSPVVQADSDPVDLVLGGEGATSWNVDRTEPTGICATHLGFMAYAVAGKSDYLGYV